MKNDYFVSGYWKNNLGDDLFLYILSKRYPTKKFLISTEKKYASVFDDLENVSNIKRNILWKIFNKILSKITSIGTQDIFSSLLTNNYIEIGGSIFIENENWKKRAKQRNFNFKASKNYFVIGSNFGPYYSKEFLNSYKNFLGRCKVVFRDNSSKDIVGVNSIKVAPDVVFNLRKYIDCSKKSIIKNNKQTILFSVIDLDTEKAHRSENIRELGKKYEEKIYSYSKLLIEKNHNIVLMSFCEFEGDMLAIRRIYDKFSNIEKQSVQIYCHENIQDSLQLFRDVDRVVASRFHAMILGWVMEKPTLTISYSDKTKNTSTDLMGEKSKILEIKDFLTLNNNLLENYYTKMSDENLKNISAEAERQFVFMDGINE